MNRDVTEKRDIISQLKDKISSKKFISLESYLGLIKVFLIENGFIRSFMKGFKSSDTGVAIDASLALETFAQFMFYHFLFSSLKPPHNAQECHNCWIEFIETGIDFCKRVCQRKEIVQKHLDAFVETYSKANSATVGLTSLLQKGENL